MSLGYIWITAKPLTLTVIQLIVANVIPLQKSYTTIETIKVSVSHGFIVTTVYTNDLS